VTDINKTSKEFIQAAERTTTLYALSDEYTRLVNLLDDPEVDAELVEAELDRISGAIAKKAEAICGLIRWFEGLADMRSFEAKRMADGAAGFQRQADRLRAYLLRNMQAAEMTRIDTARFTLSVRQNPPRVHVLEEMLVPSDFKRTKLIEEIDRRLILNHMKQTGEIVDGVEIVRDTRLEIR
jgi:Siphovirus Gp157